VITRLCEQWQAEREVFAQRDLSEVDYVLRSAAEAIV
jgi:hypothetical protein